MKAGSLTHEQQRCLRAQVAPQTKTDSEDVCDDKINMPDYFRSSTKRVADKIASAV